MQGPRGTLKFLACIGNSLSHAFGHVRRTGSRGANGLTLVAPPQGFNNHGCIDHSARVLRDCRNWTEWGTTWGKYGWSLDDVYYPNMGMFAIHAKEFDVLSKEVLMGTLAPSDVTC